LRAAWGGIEGERMWRALRGESVLRPAQTRSTISHSHVLAPAQRNDTDARAVLHRLLQKAAMRLRKIEHFAGGLSLSIRYVSGGRWDDARQFLESQDTIEFIHVLNTLWDGRPRHGGVPLHVGVTLFHLAPQCSVTPSLFGGEKRQKLNTVVDALNSALGKNTVYFGGAHTALDSAPMRIAFNRIPDLETEGD
jgi:DNA polymerase-4